MDLSDPHAWIGLFIVSIWGIISGWSLALRYLRYDETPTFWRVVSIAQVAFVVQALIGLALFLMGRRPGDGSLFQSTFHVLYGIVFPVVVLFFAHKWAREGRYETYGTFSAAAFVLFAMTARGWMQGAGMG